MTGRSTRTAWLLALALAAASLCGTQAWTAEGIAGTYCLRGVHEVGSCLRLASDQQFEYFLAYGAYDERSQGQWRAEGDEVVLDSPAYNKAPTFTFKGFAKAEGDGFDIAVVDKAGQPINGIDVRARCDGHAVDVGVTGTGGYRLDCKSAPDEVMLGIRMFGVAEQTLKVSAPAGADKAYVFAFEPGDLGQKRFAGTRLRREGPDALEMTYANPLIEELNGKRFRYEREGQ